MGKEKNMKRNFIYIAALVLILSMGCFFSTENQEKIRERQERKKKISK